MEKSKIIAEGITFDDVLLIPARSNFIPSQAQTSTQLTNNIAINIPIISAAMDTVTESALAIALAQEGGIGIIHKNLSLESQKREVEKVKRSENGVIVDYRPGFVRVSPHFYNTEEEIDRCIDVLSGYGRHQTQAE